MNIHRVKRLLLTFIFLIFTITYFQCDYLVYPKEENESTWNVYFNKSVNITATDQSEAVGNVRLDLKLTERILSSKETIDFCFYKIESDTVLSALTKAYFDGIQVRIITDNKYLDEISRLKSLNIPIISDSAGSIYISKDMHNKFAVFDGEWVWTGSYNVTINGTFGNANNAIEFKSKEVANSYTLEFEEMWGSSSNKPDISKSKFHINKTDNSDHIFDMDGYPLEVYMSPSDETKQVIQNAIASADYEIYFCIFSFTDSDISRAMYSQLELEPGLIINGVFDKTQAGSQYSEFEKINKWGKNVTVRVDAVTDTSGTGKFLHHKYLLIDAEHEESDPILITGSTNWSANGFNYNDENLIITYHPEIVNLYLREFQARYSESEQVIDN